MRFARLAVASSVAIVLNVGAAFAQTATQVVRFEVVAVNQIGVTGTPAPLVVNSATAGSQPTAVTMAGSSYAVTTNETNQKITATINEGLPAGLTLEVSLAAPPGATSAGHVSLGTASADVVTGLSNVAASALPITYRLSSTASVRMTAQATRVVTYTIVSGT